MGLPNSLLVRDGSLVTKNGAFVVTDANGEAGCCCETLPPYSNNCCNLPGHAACVWAIVDPATQRPAVSISGSGSLSLVNPFCGISLPSVSVSASGLANPGFPCSGATFNATTPGGSGTGTRNNCPTNPTIQYFAFPGSNYGLSTTAGEAGVSCLFSTSASGGTFSNSFDVSMGAGYGVPASARVRFFFSSGSPTIIPVTSLSVSPVFGGGGCLTGVTGTVTATGSNITINATFTAAWSPLVACPSTDSAPAQGPCSGCGDRAVPL